MTAHPVAGVKHWSHDGMLAKQAPPGSPGNYPYGILLWLNK
jgi:hypothetical protein